MLFDTCPQDPAPCALWPFFRARGISAVRRQTTRRKLRDDSREAHAEATARRQPKHAIAQQQGAEFVTKMRERRVALGQGGASN